MSSPHPDPLNANADTAEIAKFSKLSADDWWGEKGACSPLHKINPLRINFIKQHAGADLNNRLILDIGCGGGILSESLAMAGAQVTGIDLSETALSAAHAHWLALQQTSDFVGRLDYRLSSAEDFAHDFPGKFDMITCMEMLEHVPDSARIILSCYQLLKPGGKLFLSTINRNIKAYLQAIIGAEWILKLLPKSTHEYAKFIKPSELCQWLRDAGLTLKAIEGMSYHLLSRQYYLTSDRSVNYLVYAEKI